MKKYGLTEREFEALLAAQGHACAICRKPAGLSKARLCVDHCHKTGRVRALLCVGCNVGLGSLGDDPERVAAALKYLRHHAKRHAKEARA